MGVVSDWVNEIGDWFDKTIHDLLATGVENCFKGIHDILTTTYSSATEDGGLMATFITTHPSDFTGGVTNGTTVWDTIKSLCDTVIVPIAGYILVIILLNDLIQMCIAGNNLKDFDDSIFFKWIIKSVCGILLVSNTYAIATGLFSFGTQACTEAISDITGSTIAEFNFDVFSKALDDFDNGELLIMLLISSLILVAIMLLAIVIVVVLASRIIEIFMYLGISPIPMATFMNNDWGQIGKNWIKGALALSFQGFFIIIALSIFHTIFANVTDSITAYDGEKFTGGASDIIMSLLMLCGYAGALIFTVLRSGQISRSAFNAT